MKHANSTVPVITIDGPSGTGKGTISLLVAQHLGWHFLDSGAIYRVLAYALRKKHVSMNSLERLIHTATHLNLRFGAETDAQSQVFLDGDNISAAIRTEACGQDASKIAAILEVRHALLERQRAFATPPGLVTDGRDMGTVVFPHASLKIYLHASAEARAHRRYLQLKAKGNDVSLQQIIDELTQRDTRDRDRSHSPLVPAEDAVVIDTTRLTIAQVQDSVLQLARSRGLVESECNIKGGG